MTKFMQGFLIMAIVALGICGFDARSTAQPAANPEDILKFNDGAWSVSSGGKQTAFDGITGSGEQHGKTIEWCVVNPAELKGAEGLKPGVLLHSESWEKPVYLLLDEEALGVLGLSIRPDGFDIAVISRLSRFTQLLSLYNIEYDDNPYERRKSFQIRTDSVFWTKDADDNPGMAISLADEKMERPEEAGLFASTAVVYYPPPGVKLLDDGMVIVKQATNTESFEISGVSADGSELTISTISVKSGKDWTDADKWLESEIKVKVPPMPAEDITGEAGE